MPYRTWLFIATLGLTLSADLGQTQEQGESPSGQTGQEQDPVTPDIPTPFPVEIVEDDATADARQRSEEEARQREISDLAAQEGMNAATQSIDQATRDMRDYALYSTIAVWVGTALLIITLVLTWMANKSALAAVKVTRDLGLAEHRPYVDVDFGGCISHWDRTRGDKIFWKIRLILSNSGNTPTLNLRVRSCWRIVDAGDDLSIMPQNVPAQIAYLRGHKSFAPLTILIDGDILSKVRDGEKNLFVFIEAKYGTFLKKDESFVSRCGFKATNITGNPDIYWDEGNPVTIDWEHVPTYFCYDNECES